jgi:hypothetical protein
LLPERMTAFLALVNRAVDFLFGLMRPLPALAVLSVFAILTAIFTLLVFRWTSNQKAIRRAKDRIGAHVLEVRLFPDQLLVVGRAYLSLLGNVLLYLRHSLRPLLVLAVPLLLLFVQMEAYFGRTPLEPGRDFLLRATLAKVEALDEMKLRLPPGLTLTAPPVRIPLDREVDWRLQAERPGQYDVLVLVAGNVAAKKVVVGGSLARLDVERVRGGIWQQILNPGEAPLPRAGPFDRIEVQYPGRTFPLRTWEMDWIVPFLAITLVAALALKGLLRTEL